MSKSFYVKSIGSQVVITRKSGLKNMRLSVHPKKGVTVSLPMMLSYKAALFFIDKKQEWIKKKLKEIDKHKHNYVNNIIENGFKTHNRSLRLFFDTEDKCIGNIDEEFVNMHFPKSWDTEMVKTQEMIRDFLKKVLVLEAKEYIPQRVKTLALKHNLRYKDIRIGSAKTRWGTCRQDNRLTFSCYLMLMKDELIDYIILHELTHIIHKNHSKDFYNMLNKLCDGQHKRLNAEVKNFKTPLTSKYQRA